MKILDEVNHHVAFRFADGFIRGEIHCSAKPGSDCYFVCADADCYTPHSCAHAKVDEGSCVLAGAACLDYLGDSYVGSARPVASGPIVVLWDDEQNSFLWTYLDEAM